MTEPKPRRPGPKPDVLKIDLPIGEALRRLAQAPPITKAQSRYSTRKRPKRTA